MRHDKTKRALRYFQHLQALQSGEDALIQPVWPERTLIDPAACRDILGDLFVLELHAGAMRYRLAGTHVCSLYERELKGEGFGDAFNYADASCAEEHASRCGADGYLALLSSAMMDEDGRAVSGETLLMPLAHQGLTGLRVLGITVTLERRDAGISAPIIRQGIRKVRMLRPWEDEPIHHEPEETDASLPFMPAPDSQSPSFPLRVDNADPNWRRKGHLHILDGGLNGIRNRD